ncbi:MAG: hypothetical protein ACKOYJ_08700 [Planctomycetia bacterium]
MEKIIHDLLSLAPHYTPLDSRARVIHGYGSSSISASGPCVWLVYAIKCAIHFDHHGTAARMAAGPASPVNTF